MRGFDGEWRPDIHKVVAVLNVNAGVDEILVSAGWPKATRNDGRGVEFISAQHGRAWMLARAFLSKWTLDAGPFIDKVANCTASKVNEQYRSSDKAARRNAVARSLIHKGQAVRDKILRRLARRFMPTFAEYGHG
jgi:hypothetical protein